MEEGVERRGWRGGGVEGGGWRVVKCGRVEGWRGGGIEVEGLEGRGVGVEGSACGYRYRTEPKVRNTFNTDTTKNRRRIGID